MCVPVCSDVRADFHTADNRLRDKPDEIPRIFFLILFLRD